MTKAASAIKLRYMSKRQIDVCRTRPARAGRRLRKNRLEGGETEMAEKNKCRVVIKCGPGKECTLPVDCCEGVEGERVIVVRCDTEAADCCSEDEK